MGCQILSLAALAGAAALAACATVDPVIETDRPGQTAVLGEHRFEFDRDRETIAVGPAFAGAEAIAVRPLNGDAECTRVVANFANGEARDLPIETEGLLAAGGTYWMALPEGGRNLTGIELVCRPLRPGVRVDMQVLATTDTADRRG